jgi:hypothetical protein
MRRRWMIVALAVAVLVAGVLVAAPVLARAGGPGPATQATVQRPQAGPGWATGMGAGRGMGAGPMMGAGQARGMGPGAGQYPDCQGLAAAPSGTLTSAQKATLAAIAEEEKLAHDLYAAFAARYDPVVFDRIAAAETRHLAAVRTLLGRYRVADPTAGKAAGSFASATVQATYDRLLQQGSASQRAALGVGVTVEQDDIAALQQARSGLTAQDVRQVYGHLLTASRRHLAAFQAWQR